MTQPMYPGKNPEDYASDFSAHMQAMTAEGLHSKSDIAVQLSWRDAELRRLHAELERKSDAIQRLWKERDALRDELALQKALVAEAQAMTAKVCAENNVLEEALRKISAIENQMYGDDWEEIEEARNIADAAIDAARKEGK